VLPPVELVKPTPEEFRERFLHYLRYSCGLELRHARAADHLTALELAVRESLIDRAILTHRTYDREQPKTVHYLSVEYMLGRLLRNNLIATDLLEVAHEAMQQLGLNLDTIVEEEPDPGLGNGGLGRLAACYLDSLATLDYPAYGYGLRYDYGMFRQDFEDGWQVEHADTWLEEGYPWEVERSDIAVPVMIGGHIDWKKDDAGKHHPQWRGARTFYGVPHDVLVSGYGTRTVATLRLWRATAPAEFDYQIFSQGDYMNAVSERERVEAITRVLYPADHVESGRLLRDAILHRRGRCQVGRRLGAHPRELRLHQSHPSARGARDLAGVDDGVPDPAPRADHLRNRPPVHGVGKGELRRRSRQDATHVDPPRGTRQTISNGQSGDHRQPPRQRCRQAAHRAPPHQGGQGVCRLVAGTLHSDNQRHHAAALAARLQSTSCHSHHPQNRP
jgi:hypothetical protein